MQEDKKNTLQRIHVYHEYEKKNELVLVRILLKNLEQL